MTEQPLPHLDLGPIAAALAKAQTAFPTITRDKKVTVQTKTGGSYSFNYAPLDTILAAVRGPLSANGLALVQMLDEGALVTLLIHESGASLSGRIDLPQTTDIQALGSAVTYLRRYAIQAILGIAAEEDDDGNRAAGNRVVSADVDHGDDGSLIGTVEVGAAATSDYSVRNDANLGPTLGFRLRGQRGGILVRASGPLAEQLFTFREAVVGKRVTCWGRVTDVPGTTNPPRRGYQVLAAERVSVPEIGVLPTSATPTPDAAPEPSTGPVEAESMALFDAAAQAEVDAELDRILA